MQDYFDQLAVAVCAPLPGIDRINLSYAAEDSNFIRFNHALVRQATHVDQRNATVAVIAVMASALLAFAGLAMRARRTVRAKPRGDDVIEARHQGGHHWVAYGWNDRR